MVRRPTKTRKSRYIYLTIRIKQEFCPKNKKSVFRRYIQINVILNYQKNKRRPRPPGGDFFDLAQLFASLGSKGNNRKKAEKGKENEKQRPPDLSFLFGPPLRNGKPKKQKPNPRPTPPANVDELKNPQVLYIMCRILF